MKKTLFAALLMLAAQSCTKQEKTGKCVCYSEQLGRQEYPDMTAKSCDDRSMQMVRTYSDAKCAMY